MTRMEPFEVGYSERESSSDRVLWERNYPVYGYSERESPLFTSGILGAKGAG